MEGEAAALTCAASTESGGDAVPMSFSDRGPYSVGQVDLQLDPDHQIAVFYPVEPDTEDEAEPYSYSGEAIFGAEFAALLPEAMAGEFAPPDTWVEAPPSQDGPFPLVLHSHGFSGNLRFANYHNAHTASWGFVVAAVDHPERGVVSILDAFLSGGEQPEREPFLDTQQLLDGLDLIDAETETVGSILEGAVDTECVAAEGHSAGGSATGAASYDTRIDAWIGQASGGVVDPAVGREQYLVDAEPDPDTGSANDEETDSADDEEVQQVFDSDAYRAENPPPQKPTMMIAAEGDTVVELAGIESTYDWLDAPKRLAVIAESGHAVFVDPCAPIREAGGLRAFVEGFGVVPDEVPLVRLGEDGCLPENKPAEEVWAVIDHLTIAQLDWVFAMNPDTAAASLETDYLDQQFPGMLERYDFED